jgi:hypothetical protein
MPDISSSTPGRRLLKTSHSQEIQKNDEKQNVRFFEKIVCEFIRKIKYAKKIVCECDRMTE